MFSVPETVVPEHILRAANFLKSSNEFFDLVRDFQRKSFLEFWYRNGVLRTKEEVNMVLEAMDSVAPGQSAKFFSAAAGLAQLILNVSPGSLGDQDWLPPYEYTVDPVTYSVRVV